MSATHDEFRQAIDEFFAELGPASRELLAREILRPGGLGRLLRLLAIPDPGHADDQYTALLNHLRRHGEATLSRAIEEDRRNHGSGAAPGPAPRPAASTTSTRKPEPTPGLARVRAVMPAGKGLPVAKIDQRPNAPPTTPAPPPLPIGSALPGTPADAPGTALPARPPLPPLAPQVDREAGKGLADWDGTERRSGAERRSGVDRRDKIEVTFKNKRYGRDRRGKQERRRNWPPKDQGNS